MGAGFPALPFEASYLPHAKPGSRIIPEAQIPGRRRKPKFPEALALCFAAMERSHVSGPGGAKEEAERGASRFMIRKALASLDLVGIPVGIFRATVLPRYLWSVENRNPELP